MKHHLIAFFDRMPENELSKMLNWALTQANMFDDRTPYENRTRKSIYDAMYQLEKPTDKPNA